MDPAIQADENIADGLDGLAGGESLLSLIALAILGYLADDTLLPGLPT